MTAIMQTLLFMLAVLAGIAVAAKRLNIAPSILLVAAGIGMALVPGLPKVELAPDVVLLVILPPLIYSAGVAMSWREFRFNLRPIARGPPHCAARRGESAAEAEGARQDGCGCRAALASNVRLVHWWGLLLAQFLVEATHAHPNNDCH